LTTVDPYSKETKLILQVESVSRIRKREQKIKPSDFQRVEIIRVVHNG